MCSVFLLDNAMYRKEEMTAKEWLRPNLILVCGLPGSGKTTIARRLEQETGAIRLNVDEWVAALGVDFFDFEFRLRLESRLYEAQHRARRCFSSGRDLVVGTGLG